MIALFFYSLIVLLLVFALLIVIGTLHSGISPMPSSTKAYQCIKDMVNECNDHDKQTDNASLDDLQLQNQPLQIVDLGSGWGHIVLKLAKEYPDKTIHGYEISYLPWLVSQMLKRLYKLENLHLHRKNFLTTDWPDHSILICYLFPDVMNSIADKIRESKGIEWVICNNFALPSYDPIRKETIADFYRSPMYLYRIGADNKEMG